MICEAERKVKKSKKDELGKFCFESFFRVEIERRKVKVWAEKEKESTEGEKTYEKRRKREKIEVSCRRARKMND
jgi:hypothetical protein